MIYKTEIIYSGAERKAALSDIAVKIHGAVMGLIPTEYAGELHRNSLQPFSLCCTSEEGSNNIILRISALNSEARVINSALTGCDEIKIYGINEPIKRLSYTSSEIDIGAQAAKTGDKVRLSILTPAIYRSGGRSFCTPELTRFFRSTAERYVRFTGEGDADYLCGLISKIHLTNYSLSGKSYNISGNIYNGMTGFADIPITRKADDAFLMKKLLVFASYSGIGAKTAMGMGGVKIENI